MKIESSFVVSAAAAGDLPRDALPEVALVGRSNVGKSSLINALVRQRVARTSGAPGKTRLANVYRVRRGAAAAFYLVDLPGYGFARGDRRELTAVTSEYFGRVGRVSEKADAGGIRAALLLIDARHVGLVATKIDKLSRSERQRAMKTNEAVFEHPVLPVSADTGEGLDELWKLIDRLTTPE
jgi:GTP-binding protein